MQIGLHVSTAVGLSKSSDRAIGIRDEAIQIPGSSPQKWSLTLSPQIQIDLLSETINNARTAPIYPCCMRLVNLGIANWERLIQDMGSIIFLNQNDRADCFSL